MQDACWQGAVVFRALEVALYFTNFITSIPKVQVAIITIFRRNFDSISTFSSAGIVRSIEGETCLADAFLDLYTELKIGHGASEANQCAVDDC